MEKGLLSVIITTYCREFHIIRQSIDSVLAQTYKNIELIIVDDNPPDNGFPEKILKGLESYPQVKYLKMRKNSGACAARNKGILESSGEYVGFLDDDDLWLPEKAEKQIRFFADPEVGLAFCAGYTFRNNDTSNTKPYYTTKDFNPAPTFEDMLHIDRIGSTSQVILRREVFCICGMFDAEMPARQDYEMWLRVTKKGVLARGEREPLYMYRFHEGDQITKVPKKALDAYIRLYYKYKPDFRKHKIADFIALTTLSGLYRRCGQPARGIWYMIRAFFRTPAYFMKCAVNAVKK